MESPCVKLCMLDRGVCQGCGRTKQEIFDWINMSDKERSDVMKRLSDYKNVID